MKHCDIAEIEISDDEITNHVELRYVSASEAIWTTFTFRISLSILLLALVTLPVHSEGEHIVVFRDTTDPSVLKRTIKKRLQN